MAVGVIKAKLYFKLGDRECTLDYRKVPATAWRTVKAAAGVTQKTVLTGVLEGDLDAVVSLIFLERSQRERNLNYHQVQNELDRSDNELDFYGATMGSTVVGEIPEHLLDAEEDPTTGS